MPGFFITFEGGEGSGKTSQIARLAATLRSDGHAVTTTREPGGSPGADALRHVILSAAAEALGPEMEAILFAAARADHVATTIAPALARGEIVVSDRFLDSTRVYQGLDPAVGPELVASLERAVLSGIYPDLTVVLDVDAETGLHRAAERRGAAAADRFERETLELHEARRQGFLDIAAREPERCVVVDGRRNWMAVATDIAAIVDDRMQAVRLETLGRDISGADAAASATRRAVP